MVARRSIRRSNRLRPKSKLIANREVVARLFDEAERYFDEEKKDLAKRRVRAARRTAMKIRLSIPEYWNRYCRKCNSYLKQGVNSTIRIKNRVRILRCLECGSVRRKVFAPKSPSKVISAR